MCLIASGLEWTAPEDASLACAYGTAQGFSLKLAQGFRRVFETIRNLEKKACQADWEFLIQKSVSEPFLPSGRVTPFFGVENAVFPSDFEFGVVDRPF